MIYSDHNIDRGVVSKELMIEPYNRAQLQPASYDVLMGDRLLVPGDGFGGRISQVINPMKQGFEPNFWEFELDSAKWASIEPYYDLEPGGFILAHTLETIALPLHVAARIEGKSTLGRWGLVVHVTAGFIDPGFKGQVTLELKNVGPFTIHLTRHMPIAQISFHGLLSAADKGYAGKYQGSRGVVGPRSRIAAIEAPAVDGLVVTEYVEEGEKR